MTIYTLIIRVYIIIETNMKINYQQTDTYVVILTSYLFASSSLINFESGKLKWRMFWLFLNRYIKTLQNFCFCLTVLLAYNYTKFLIKITYSIALSDINKTG